MGLGRPTALAVEAPRGRWDDDGDAAKRLTRLLRAQSRRLRAVRLALHAGTPTPPIDHVLASESVPDNVVAIYHKPCINGVPAAID
jgi:hypothetical protein